MLDSFDLPNLPTIEISTNINDLIKVGEVGKEVLNLLMPDGNPLQFETEFWDYKDKIPLLGNARIKDREEKRKNEAALCEIIKDVVAFYNAFGGYIICTDTYSGFLGNSDIDTIFDIGRFNEKLRSYTGINIDCRATLLELTNSKVLVIYIPKRPSGIQVASFRKSAQLIDGKGAFYKDDTYFRENDQCIPAKTPDHFSFLLGARPWQTETNFLNSLYVENNLPAKDPNLIKFVGRQGHLDALWRWLSSGRDPVRMLTGLGGFGKTSIAYEFCRNLIESHVSQFDKIIWVSGKRKTFAALEEKYVDVVRNDFIDAITCLQKIALELGASKDDFDEEDTIDDYVSLISDALSHFSIFLVVDDLDSLDTPTDQSDLFNAIQNIANRTLSDQKGLRVLFTSRLLLGASSSQRLTVDGLGLDEFQEFILTTSNAIGLKADWAEKKRLLRKLHRASQGSPVFGAAILVLTNYGSDIDAAIDRWKNEDGEDVRRFAFEKELQQLSETECKILYGATLLESTTSLELEQVLELGRVAVKDALANLRQYHLITSEGDPATGLRLHVPSSIILMRDLVRSRCIDPAAVERSYHVARKGAPKNRDDVARIINEIITLWRDEAHDDAVRLASEGVEQFPKSGDLFCILGRALCTHPKDRTREADKAFKEAHRLNCKRQELYQLWMNVKIRLFDWAGCLAIYEKTPDFLKETDPIVSAVIQCHQNLAAEAMTRGDPRECENRNRVLIDFCRKLRKKPNVSYSAKAKLKRHMHTATMQYLKATYARVGDRYDDALEIFRTAKFAIESDILDDTILKVAILSLKHWWAAVKKRAQKDGGALEILRSEIEYLEKLGARETLIGISMSSLDELHRFTDWIKGNAEIYEGRK